VWRGIVGLTLRFGADRRSSSQRRCLGQVNPKSKSTSKNLVNRAFLVGGKLKIFVMSS
jgi:hypothetical protein